MAGYTRTVILLAALTALFGVIGLMIGGEQGMIMALLFAGGMNLFSWWNSDKMVLRMHNAQPISPQEAPRLYDMTAQLAANAGLPMPALYVIHEEQPNAFATGRNPQNAAVAVNTGLLDMLSEEEVAGVIAHNLIGYLGGYWGGRLLGFDKSVCRTLAIEVGMQNSGLAASLGAKFFSPMAALPGAIFSVWHNISGSLLAGYWSSRPTGTANDHVRREDVSLH